MIEMGDRLLKTSGDDGRAAINDLTAFAKTASSFLPDTSLGRDDKKRIASQANRA